MIDNTKAKAVADALSWNDAEKVKAIVRAFALEIRSHIQELAENTGDAIPVNLKDVTGSFSAEAVIDVAERFGVDVTVIPTIVTAFSTAELRAEADHWQDVHEVIGRAVAHFLNPGEGGSFAWQRFYDDTEGMEMVIVRPALVDLSKLKGADPGGAISWMPVNHFEISGAIEALKGIVDSVDSFGYAEDDDESYIYVEAQFDGSPLSVYIYLDNPFDNAEPLDPDEAFSSD